jgi:hypothetical protein
MLRQPKNSDVLDFRISLLATREHYIEEKDRRFAC